MYVRALALSVVCVASACSAAVQSGEQRAQALVSVAQEHLGVQDAKRSVGQALGRARRDFKETRYDSPTVGRFVTYYTTSGGAMKEFVVNQPSANPYVPIKSRVVFIERMMEIAAPDSSPAERAWGSKQLDSLWTPSTHPLPVQVGDYVFSGFTGGYGESQHDNLRIVAADTGAAGLKYRPRP